MRRLRFPYSRPVWLLPHLALFKRVQGIFSKELQSPEFNPLNAELNPICHLLALLGAHPVLHVSRIRVKADHL